MVNQMYLYESPSSPLPVPFIAKQRLLFCVGYYNIDKIYAKLWKCCENSKSKSDLIFLLPVKEYPDSVANENANQK